MAETFAQVCVHTRWRVCVCVCVEGERVDYVAMWSKSLFPYLNTQIASLQLVSKS